MQNFHRKSNLLELSLFFSLAYLSLVLIANRYYHRYLCRKKTVAATGTLDVKTGDVYTGSDVFNDALRRLLEGIYHVPCFLTYKIFIEATISFP